MSRTPAVRTADRVPRCFRANVIASGSSRSTVAGVQARPRPRTACPSLIGVLSSSQTHLSAVAGPGPDVQTPACRTYVTHEAHEHEFPTTTHVQRGHNRAGIPRIAE